MTPNHISGPIAGTRIATSTCERELERTTAMSCRTLVLACFCPQVSYDGLGLIWNTVGAHHSIVIFLGWYLVRMGTEWRVSRDRRPHYYHQ